MDPIRQLQISDSQLKKIHQHLSTSLPNEGCGILAGLDWNCVHVFLTPNKLMSQTRFEIDPKSLLKAFQMIEKKEWRFMAIFHSHPNGPDQLSSTDFANHYYTDVVQILFFPKNGKWQHRAFSINGESTTEIPIKIVTN